MKVCLLGIFHAIGLVILRSVGWSIVFWALHCYSNSVIFYLRIEFLHLLKCEDTPNVTASVLASDLSNLSTIENLLISTDLRHAAVQNRKFSQKHKKEFVLNHEQSCSVWTKMYFIKEAQRDRRLNLTNSIVQRLSRFWKSVRKRFLLSRSGLDLQGVKFLAMKMIRTRDEFTAFKISCGVSIWTLEVPSDDNAYASELNALTEFAKHDIVDKN